MNFKTLLLLALIFNFGCGVKSSPVPPKETILPSIDTPFLEKMDPPTQAKDSDVDTKDEKKKKKANKK